MWHTYNDLPKSENMDATDEIIHELQEHINKYSNFLWTWNVESDDDASEVILSFSFLPYDSIDDDLDFDEFEYQKLQLGFKRSLENTLSSVTTELPGFFIVCRELKMEFGDRSEALVEESIYTHDPTRRSVKVVKTYWTSERAHSLSSTQ